ncbi:MAG TPA: phosphopantothenoylcysteine decarboxylase [Phycisphaerae bacterium]|nr:phosphopantothenoylcysteine decarboxylase [Phycisphaerae bacterium]
MDVLITAGPTREYLDPVRFLSNASTGRMGCALASAAKAQGHRVTLVLGPASVDPPEVDELVRVTTAAEMREAVLARFDGCDVFFGAAAVSDYRPVAREAQKIKKVRERLALDLERTADILGEVSARRRGQVLVGFCLETEDLEARAREKLKAKGLDLVVANGPEAIGAERREAVLIDRSGQCERLRDIGPEALALRVLAAAARCGPERRGS